MKKLLSIMLAMAMVLTLVVMPANAIEGTYVAYYVGDTIDGAEVTGLTAGGTYVPDRMPTASAPEGKYFAGWKDKDGNYVLDGGMTLSQGENALYAAYVDNVGKVSGNIVSVQSDRVAYPSYDENGSNFMLSLPGARSNYCPIISYEYEGKTYPAIKGVATWDYQHFMVTDGNGAALQLQPGHTYEISITYRTTDGGFLNNLSLGYGFSIASGNGYRTAYNSNTVKPMTKVALGATSCTHDTDNLLNVSANSGGWREWITIINSNGHNGYNLATSTGWETITFSGTVPEDMTGYYPLLMGSLRVGPHTAIFKEIVVKDSEYVEPAGAATVTYYVGDQKDGETVTGYTGGETYVPDRMPNTSAPEGKYFAGWKDEEGNYVLDDGMTLKEGENALYAAYVDNVGKVSGNIVSVQSDRVAYPSYDENGENFMLSLPGARSNYCPIISYEYEGKTYPAIKGVATWDYQHFMVTDGNGAALQLQPGHTYEISITYRTTDGGFLNNLSLGYGFSNASGNGYRTAYNSNTVKPMTKVALGATSCTHDTDNLLNVSANSGGWREWITIINSNGHNVYNLATSTGWETITFSGTVPEDMTGYYPLLMGSLRVGPHTAIFKEIVVKDAAYKEPATVTYYVGEEQDGEVVTGLLEGETYTPDRTPTTVTPAGKNFAGWAYNGEIVDSITLAAGENKLYAVYKDIIIANGGVSMLKGVEETAIQALRYYFSYNTTTGEDIVIDGEIYKVASRGFLLADADKIGAAVVTRETAAQQGSGIIDMNITDLTKCWDYIDNGDGTAKLVFSTYITGFVSRNGTYNNTERLYAKAYVVLEDGSVFYSEATAKTVADVANELGIVG